MFPSRSDRRGRAVVGLAIAVALLGACVKPKHPGVGIAPLNADIVFGVEKPQEAAPAGFVPTAIEGQGTTDQTDLLPEQTVTTAPKKNFPRPPFEAGGPAKSDCPAADVNAFPLETAPENVPDKSRLPQQGIYKWKQAGSVTRTNASGASSVTQLGGLVERRVQNVQLQDPVPTDSAGELKYTFQVIEPDISTGNRLLETYYVDTAAPSTIQHPNGTGLTVTGGSPERGLVLRSIEPIDLNGNKLPGAFHASPGLLIAPLPIRPSETWSSVAVDPTTQETIQFDGTMVKRDRVDACGEIIEGWAVTGKRTVSTSSGSGSQDYNVIVAPHLGMLLLNEHINGLGVSADLTIGQRVPAPLPEAGS